MNVPTKSLRYSSKRLTQLLLEYSLVSTKDLIRKIHALEIFLIIAKMKVFLIHLS